MENNTQIKATPMYKDYLKSYNAENKAIQKTTEKIETIKATGLTTPEFFTLLWDEKFPVPEQWPLNTAGKPLSPNSSKTRAAVPEVNRLVSALAMRNKREADKEKPDNAPVNAPDPEPEPTGAKIEEFNKDACVKQLQALLVASFEVKGDEDIYNAAKGLVKLLIDKK